MSIELENVSYTYSVGTPFEMEALRDISLQIGDGEFVGLMGRMGCGKSTMIQLVAGLIAPGTGRILIDGKDICAKGYPRHELRKSVGIVFQYPECQIFETTVEKDVAFGLKHSGLSHEDVTQRVKWALFVTGFNYDEIRLQSPLALSGGQKRLVAIAGVLAAKPKILIFDEPIAGLDPLSRQFFLDLVTKLNHDGVTIMIVSHNADSIGAYANRIVVLDNGRLIADNTPKAIFSDVARMRELRLGVSQPRLVADMLQKRGVSFPQDIVAYNELLAATLHFAKCGKTP